MGTIVKQVSGIDVSKAELVVCLGRMYDDWTPELYSSKSFANTRTGFKQFVEWVKKFTKAEIPVRFVMEATGVYHESLAYYLEEQGLEVTIVLPNKISNYARTLELKTITDKTSSQAITLFGLERKLDLWSRPKGIFKILRQLTRERAQIVVERTVLKNQLHAERAEAEPLKGSIERIEKRIKLLNRHEKEIKMVIEQLIKTDPQIQKAVILICSIPGIGILTAASILGETNGFDLIQNKKQLVRYAGLDVREKQSGTSVKGTPRISKKGNKHLRKTMHMPALAAIRFNERYKAIFTRLVSKHGIKMKAVVAIQRKLLEMTYNIYKSGSLFDKNYFNVDPKLNTICMGAI